MEIDQSNKDFVTYDGILYSSDYELAYVVPAGIVGPVRMPEAVTIIPGGFFSECKNLKGVISTTKSLQSATARLLTAPVSKL